MKTPTYGPELQQLLCATSCILISLPAYTQVIAPLLSLMEDTYKKAGKRIKKEDSKIRVSDSRGSEHDEAFMRIKPKLAAFTKLARPRHIKRFEIKIITYFIWPEYHKIYIYK